MAKRPGGVMVGNEFPTKSQLFPILSKWNQLGDKSQLLPMLVTIVAVLFMFVYSSDTRPLIIRTGNHPQFWIYTSYFIIIVAIYLTLMSLYFIYRLAGKKKSWLAMLVVMAFVGYCVWLLLTTSLLSPVYQFFHGFLAGGGSKRGLPFSELFYKQFVGTAFFEELFKIFPLFVIIGFSGYMSPDLREKFSIREPLDGILFGAAGGGGFAIVETIGQYVPTNLVQIWMKLALDLKRVPHGYTIPTLPPNVAASLIDMGMPLMGTSPGIQLLIPRSLDQAFGHMAYSGIFGYFVGLAMMRPEHKWKLLPLGLVTASLCHALWNSVASLDVQMIQMFVALLSYAVLAAAILKAREISPNRAKLQPSVVFGTSSVRPAAEPAAAYGAQAAANYAPPTPVLHPPVAYQAQALPPAPPDLPAGTPSLRIGGKYLVIVPGLRILEHQAPGLRPQTPGGPVAEITRNPQDPAILGLTNLSTSSWEVVTPSGTRREIQPGQTVKLGPGTKIDFGVMDGEVR